MYRPSPLPPTLALHRNSSILAASLALATIAGGLGGCQGGASDATGQPGTSTRAATAPPVRTAIDVLGQAPNGRNVWPSDSGARSTLITDLSPSGQGDLFGLFYAGNETAGDAWVLLVSTDGGATFSYLAASNAEPNPDPSHRRPVRNFGLTQDTVSYKVHTVWWPRYDTKAAYNRIALTRNPSGHISGWSWEAERLPAPSFSAAGSWEGAAKLDLKEVIDGNGQHVLMMVGMDQPSSTRIQRLVACRTVAGSKALAPAAASDWVKITTGAAGYDVIAAYNSDTRVDSTALLNLTSQADTLQHMYADYTFVQLAADRSLHFFDGPMVYASKMARGELRRWRFVASGANWVLDSAANGVVVAQGDSWTRACLGNAVASANYVWLSYSSPTGLHIDRVGTNGLWSKDAVSQPDTRAEGAYWSAVSVSPDETGVYAYWEFWDTYNMSQYSERSGYYSGGAWTVNDESTSFATTGFAGSVNWNPIIMRSGVGVMSYGSQEWNTSSQRYHLHTIHHDAAGSCTPATEICGDGIDQDCNGSDLACAPCAVGAVPTTGCLCVGTRYTTGHCCATGWSSASCSSCVPQSDSSFCADHGAVCGSYSGTDNCGAQRNVSTCGGCTPPATCDSTNVCSCTPESNAQFCADLGKNCGLVSGTDSCGLSRSAIPCGTCTAPATCGNNNVCQQPTGTAVRTAVDVLAQPPNGRNLWPSDTGSRPVLISDQTPSSQGDILGLFYAGDGSAGDVWYLLVSSNGGASFAYLTASNSEPNPDSSHATPRRSFGLTQDTIAYKVHTIWWPSNGANAVYSRIALSHDSSGHVNGWSWEAERQPAPAFSVAGTWEGSAKLDIKEVIDGNGQHVLMMAAMDQPCQLQDCDESTGACPKECLSPQPRGIQRLVACRTVAGSKALAPTAASDWVKLTDGAPGYDVIVSYNTDPSVDSSALLNLTNQTKWLASHTADFAFTQLSAVKSIHFFDGPMFYNDTGNPGDIRRWRFVSNGANWSLDAAAYGALVAQGDDWTRACLGSTFATANHVWLIYSSPTGLHIDNVGSSGAWTHDVAPQPDTRIEGAYWSAMSVSPDERTVYAYWECWNTYDSSQYDERSAYYSGGTWTRYNETSTFANNGFQGATNWTPFFMRSGIGVMCYGYQEWNTSQQHYHLHTLHHDGAACVPTTEICGDGIDQDCDGSDLACQACGTGAAIPYAGCLCSGVRHADGYCCTTGWQSTACTTCVPDSDATLCANRGAECGTLDVTDNCGTSRRVTCAGCTLPATCNGGGVANTCGTSGSLTQAQKVARAATRRWVFFHMSTGCNTMGGAWSGAPTNQLVHDMVFDGSAPVGLYKVVQDAGGGLNVVHPYFMNNLNAVPDDDPDGSTDSAGAGTFSAGTLWHNHVIGSNESVGNKIAAFNQHLRAYLGTPGSAQALSRVSAGNPIYAGVKFCWVDDWTADIVTRLFPTYQATMAQLESDYPGLHIFHVAAPLQPLDSTRNGHRIAWSNQLRATYPGKVFNIDIAESTRQDGSSYTYGGQWALAPEWSGDSPNGHLSAAGCDWVGNKLLDFLATLP